MSNPTRYFHVPDRKPPSAKWPVPVDISDWLGTETIDTVTYTAKRLDTGDDVTAVVLDQSRCAETLDTISPFIQGGTGEITYLVTCHVTTQEGSEDDFYIQFTCEDYDG